MSKWQDLRLPSVLRKHCARESITDVGLIPLCSCGISVLKYPADTVDLWWFSVVQSHSDVIHESSCRAIGKRLSCRIKNSDPSVVSYNLNLKCYIEFRNMLSPI